MKVVIFAGGKGTRISEESALRPKPMIEKISVHKNDLRIIRRDFIFAPTVELNIGESRNLAGQTL